MQLNNFHQSIKPNCIVHYVSLHSTQTTWARTIHIFLYVRIYNMNFTEEDKTTTWTGMRKWNDNLILMDGMTLLLACSSSNAVEMLMTKYDNLDKLEPNSGCK